MSDDFNRGYRNADGPLRSATPTLAERSGQQERDRERASTASSAPDNPLGIFIFFGLLAAMPIILALIRAGDVALNYAIEFGPWVAVASALLAIVTFLPLFFVGRFGLRGKEASLWRTFVASFLGFAAVIVLTPAAWVASLFISDGIAAISQGFGTALHDAIADEIIDRMGSSQVFLYFYGAERFQAEVAQQTFVEHGLVTRTLAMGILYLPGLLAFAHLYRGAVRPAMPKFAGLGAALLVCTIVVGVTLFGLDAGMSAFLHSIGTPLE